MIAVETSKASVKRKLQATRDCSQETVQRTRMATGMTMTVMRKKEAPGEDADGDEATQDREGIAGSRLSSRP